MEFKKIIIILTVSITIIMALMFGVSYGWYAYSTAKADVEATTIKEIPTIIFSQTEYISTNRNMPIYDEDRYNYANKNSFTITLGTNLINYETGVEISLKDIKISDELKSSNYKYELLQDGSVIKKGDFSTLGNNNSMIIMPMNVLKPISYPKTYTYELLIWLSEDNTDQNDLMNKTFSARIDVSSAIKK